jgi:hypothetical protein
MGAPMAKSLTTSNGYVSIVDDDIYDLVKNMRWYAHNSKCGRYVQRGGIKKNGEAGKIVRLHRLITNAPCGYFVDHIDGDTLNNVRSNLRIASNGQNVHNQIRKKVSKHGYPGVSCGEGKYFYGRVMCNKKTYFTKVYDTAQEAGAARVALSERLFGSYAPSLSRTRECYINAEPN